MSIPTQVQELVDRFDRNIDDYKRGKYNETQVRREFIDPLFKAMGWDVDNTKGYAEAYKEVVHEDAIKVGRATKAPDYSFRTGGVRKFFLEAKKPSVDIKHDTHPAYQLRRYAWSAKLPLSILTDFEEFVVYDCRIKPIKTDQATVARVMYLTYKDYIDHWQELIGIFSPESIRKGSFDKYVETKKAKRGTAEVDYAFLQEIERWRDVLARNFALRNTLPQRQLNYAVQQTIDRLIFLRIAEDRGIETYGRLRKLLDGDDVYTHLFELFHRADDKYNSGLFHFKPEKGREDPDTLTPHLKLDDKVLKDIIQHLYYPDSPYEFSVLPADILGQVYEQFLGKVIRLTPKGRAVVEDKPEVKKAGGVYYTPTYIVDYIVQQTVGKLVEGKTPGQISGKNTLRVLDPACGSGSFLLGAYQFLLDWHLNWYANNDPDKWGKRENAPIYPAPTTDPDIPNWKLTIDERKRILLTHIYGVDIDPQAVEVTRLSLLLKVLEDEQSVVQQLGLFQERVLPDLDHNIKCGNSLIGYAFYDGQQVGLFDEEERYRINAFDWQSEFAEVMQTGGFDAVIGNPPYGAFFEQNEKEYIREHYKSYRYKYDSYIYFIEKGMNLAKNGGWIGFITPELWLRLENCQPLRKLVSQQAGFDKIRVFGEKVFSNVVVNTIVFILQRGISREYLLVKTDNNTWEISTASWHSNQFLSIDYRLKTEVKGLIDKIREVSTPLESWGDVIQGLTPYDRYQGQDPDLIKRRGYHFDHKKDDTCGKWLSGGNVARYIQTWDGEWLSYGSWLAAPREVRFFEGPRLLFREIPGKNKRIQATFVEETLYYGHSITPFKIKEQCELSIKYLLGIANSYLLSWYGGLTLPNFGKETFPKLNPQDIKQLPIRPINFTDPTDKARHDQMVQLVEQMLKLHQQLTQAQTPQAKTMLKRQIEATDRQIDKLVYELYGLTDEEIKIVEGQA